MLINPEMNFTTQLEKIHSRRKKLGLPQDEAINMIWIIWSHLRISPVSKDQQTAKEREFCKQPGALPVPSCRKTGSPQGT